jgi:hypothetical protein
LSTWKLTLGYGSDEFVIDVGQQNMQNKNYVYVMIFFFAKLEAELGCVCGSMQNHIQPHMTQKKTSPKIALSRASLLGRCIENQSPALNLGGVLWCEV